MSDRIFEILVGVLLPFFGTAFGAAGVFLLKNRESRKAEGFLTGGAAGIMTAASVWSLLIPASELAESRGTPKWLPCTAGFILGVLFIISADTALTRYELDKKAVIDGNLFLTVLAITIHNIPEGMAVGAALAGMAADGTSVGAVSALSLSIGIAIQNIPEGAVISAPLCSAGKSKKRSFAAGVLSGAVEPVGAVLTLALTSLTVPVLSWLLSFAAGAMIYTVFGELAPKINTKSGTLAGAAGASFGFVLMMFLDISLG